MERSLRDLLKEEGQRGTRRPTLIGTAAPGNAWDHYGRAMERLKRSGLGAVSVPLREAGTPEKLAKVEAALPRYASALEDLRRGTRCEESRSPSDYWSWSRDYEPDSPLGQIEQLAALGLSDARLLRRSGQLHEALERFLDVCQLGRDVAYNSAPPSCHIGNDILYRALKEIMDCVQCETLAADDLSGLDGAMKSLDENFPRQGHWMLNDVRRTGREMLAGRMDSLYQNRFRANPFDHLHWRYGFSRRLAEASAFERSLAWARLAAEAETQSWHAEGKAWRRILDEREASNGNVLVGFLMNREFLASSHQRTNKARIRLVRMASRFLATGEIVELDDPFGSRMGRQSREGKMAFWSIGEGGLDQEGKERGGLDRWAIRLEVGR